MIVSKRFVLKSNNLVEVNSDDDYDLLLVVSCVYDKNPITNAEHECLMNCDKCKFCELKVDINENTLIPIEMKDKIFISLNRKIDLITMNLKEEKSFQYETIYLLKELFKIYSSISAVDIERLEKINRRIRIFDALYISLRKTYREMKKEFGNKDIQRTFENKVKELEVFVNKTHDIFTKEDENGKS